MENNIKNQRQPKKNIPVSLKRQVWSSCIGREIGVALCLCCNVIEIDKDNFSCGHIVSEFNGGKLELSNLKPICMSCNSSIGTMNMNEFIKKYKLDEYVNVDNNIINNNNKQLHNQLTNQLNDIINQLKNIGDKQQIDNDVENNIERNIIIKKEYCCNNCDYHSVQLCNYKRHLESNQHAEKSKNNTAENNNKKINKRNVFYCDACDISYLTKRSLLRHMDKCKL